MESKAPAHHPLAFDANGNPMQLPEAAKRWRVRRGGGRRGRPRNVFDPDTGLQLEVPIGASLEDLIERGCTADRYRLEAVDEAGHTIEGLVAVVEVPATDDESSVESEPKKDEETVQHLRAVIDRLVAANSSTMQAMASAFGTVRPQHDAPAPVILQPPPVAPPPTESGMKPEQMMQMFTTFGPMVAQALKGFMSSGPASSISDAL